MKHYILLTIYLISTTINGHQKLNLTETSVLQPKILQPSNKINGSKNHQHFHISKRSIGHRHFETAIGILPAFIQSIKKHQHGLWNGHKTHLHALQPLQIEPASKTKSLKKNELLDFKQVELRKTHQDVVCSSNSNMCKTPFNLSEKLFLSQSTVPLKSHLHLSNFLNVPIKKVNIELIWSGCTNSINKITTYVANSDSTLVCVQDTGFDILLPKNELKGKSISSKLLYKTLTDIQSAGTRKLQIKDFKLSEAEKEFHLKKFDQSQTKTEDKDSTFRAFYISILDRMEQTDSAIFDSLINEKTVSLSVATTETEIELINQNNDTLRISKFIKGDYMIPMTIKWVFLYNNVVFPIDDIELTKYFLDCAENEMLDNSYLFQTITEILYKQSHN